MNGNQGGPQMRQPEDPTQFAWPLEPHAGTAVLAAIEARRSTARMDTETEVPQAALERALALATLAPNHRLTQPWRFSVVRGDARRRVGAAMSDESVASGRVAPQRAPLEAAKWLRAPVVVVVSHIPAADPVMCHEDRLATGAAVQNLLLALGAQGLATMWRTGAAAASAAVKEAVGLAPEEEIVAFVYVGWPLADAALPPRRRRPQEELTRWIDA